LVKLERLEIILFNAFAFFIRKSKIRATTAIGKACDLELALGCKNYARLKK
jgi:hypothetical protein